MYILALFNLPSPDQANKSPAARAFRTLLIVFLAGTAGTPLILQAQTPILFLRFYPAWIEILAPYSGPVPTKHSISPHGNCEGGPTRCVCAFRVTTTPYHQLGRDPTDRVFLLR